MYVAVNKVTLQTGAWLYGVHRTCAEAATVSCRTNHVTSKQLCRYTASMTVEKRANTGCSHACIHNRMRPVLSESAGEQTITLYKSDQQQHIMLNLSGSVNIT